MVLRGELALTVAEMLGEVLHQIMFLLRPSLRLIVVDGAGDAALMCQTVLASVDSHAGASFTATDSVMSPMPLHVVGIFARCRAFMPWCIRALWCASKGLSISEVACDSGPRSLV